MHQRLLFDLDQHPTLDPDFRQLRRTELGAGVWIDYAPGWVGGQQALFDQLKNQVQWRSNSRRMYERVVETPRLLAEFGGPKEPTHTKLHPVVRHIERALSDRYRALECKMAALYRDGRDSVAWHRDRDEAEAVVGLVSLGGRRRFLLRPVDTQTKPRASLVFWLGWGDLLVMGPGVQKSWEHCVPKVASADPRIVLMFGQSETAR